MILILLVLIKGIIGPTAIDRLISINAITSKVCMIILLMAFLKNEYDFIDAAFVFMLCGFVGGIWILRVYTPGDWEFSVSRLKSLGLKTDKKGLTLDD